MKKVRANKGIAPSKNSPNTFAVGEHIQYNVNQNNERFEAMADLLNALHDDFLRFYLMNNFQAALRVRKGLATLAKLVKETRINILETKRLRKQYGFKKTYKKPQFPHSFTGEELRTNIESDF